MIRTQVQLPSELYEKAKRFSREREISLAEVVRRGLELYFDRYSAAAAPPLDWELPRVDCGETLASLDELKRFAYDDEASRSLPKRLDET